MATEAIESSQLRMTLKSLERRINDRECSQTALRLLLLQQLGDSGVNSLMISLEEKGQSCEVLLPEISLRRSSQKSIKV